MNYNSNLKTWGSTGSAHPDGYSYIGGEQPVDEWDNFVINNIIEDLKHLISVRNTIWDSDLNHVPFSVLENTTANETYVDTQVSNHANLTNNPHSVTTTQIGALPETDYTPELDTHNRYEDSEALTAVSGAGYFASGEAADFLTVKAGKPQVQTLNDLPDATQEELGTEYFVIDENKSYEVVN